MGAALVDGLEGSEETKDRLRVVLETITGRMTVAQACQRLGIGEARFHQVRQATLQSALDGLKPGTPGRPRRSVRDPDERDALIERMRELEIELAAARVRTEIALTMPGLLRKPELQGDKKKRSRKRG